MPRPRNRPARYQPAARNFAVISGGTSLLRHLGQVLDEGVDLRRGERIAEVRGHDPGGVAGGDVRVGRHDRLLDEGRAPALEHLAEVRAGGAGRPRGGERVAGASSMFVSVMYA